MTAHRAKQLFVLGALALAVALGFFFRVYHLDNTFWKCETLTVMTGLRLHTLPFLNLHDHASLNFFKALLSEVGGMRHILSVFVSSSVYRLLGLPVTEFWLLFAYTLLGTLNIILVFRLAQALGDTRVGLIAAAMFAFSEPIIQSHRSDNAEATVSFIVSLFFVLLISYKKRRSFPLAAILGILLAIMTGMETIMLLPLVFCLQGVYVTNPEASTGTRVMEFLKYLRSAQGMVMWLPSVVAIGTNYYAYTRVGVSGLGVFGYMSYQYADRHVSLLERLSGIAGVNKLYAAYYFSAWIYWATLGVFLLVMIRNKWRFQNGLLRFSAVTFFYGMLVFVCIPSSWSAGMLHLYIYDAVNLIFFGAVWCAGIDWAMGLSRDPQRAKWLQAGGFAIVGVSLAWLAGAQAGRTLKEPIMINSLKAVGFYIHEYGDRKATVYNLWSCQGRCLDSVSEYYYGKLVMNTSWSTEWSRQSFCRGTASVETTLQQYRLEDFDFYVNLREVPLESRGGGPSQLPSKRSQYYAADAAAAELVARLGLRRVSAITYQGRVLAEVYSRREYPYRELDVTAAGRGWDAKYARVEEIITSPWVGLCSFWGYRFDAVSGL